MLILSIACRAISAFVELLELRIGERVTSCELLSSELIISSSSSPVSSSSSTEAAAAAAAGGGGDGVPVNTTVLVSCRNSSLQLSGSAQLTCQPDASWDRELPTCQLGTSTIKTSFLNGLQLT